MKHLLSKIVAAAMLACAAPVFAEPEWMQGAFAAERCADGLVPEDGESAYDFMRRICDVDDSSAISAKVKNLAMDGGTKHLYAVWRVAD